MNKKEKLPSLTHPEQNDSKLKNIGVSLSIFLDTVRKRKDGTYPVKLRVTKNRYSRYYALKYALTKSDFQKVMKKAPRGKFNKLKRKFLDEEYRAQDIIDRMEEFNFELCQERHRYLKGWCVDMEKKVQKSSNRFIMMLTGLTLNLVGVVIVLIIQIVTMK